MTTIKYTLNKRALTKEERETVSRYYRGLTALSDTITEEYLDENGNRHGATTYYIFKGSWTPYQACVKHNGRYVFARYSRYDSVSEDLKDFALDCNEIGENDDFFETHHFEMVDGKVTF